MADETYTTIALQINGLVDNVPTDISGNNMLSLIDRQRLSILGRTGLDPGSPYVSDRFKPAIMALCLSSVWNRKSVVGSDKSVSLGDFSVQAGKGGNAASAASEYYAGEAERELKNLGRKTVYGRTY